MVNWGLASRIAKDSWLINAMMSSSRTRREWRPIDAYSVGVELIKVVKLDKVVVSPRLSKHLLSEWVVSDDAPPTGLTGNIRRL